MLAMSNEPAFLLPIVAATAHVSDRGAHRLLAEGAGVHRERK
jgi:hypothetical protein